MALAASSSSRIASHARPSRPIRSRSEMNSMNATSRAKIANFAVRSNGPSTVLPILIGSIGTIPLVPLERLNPAMFSPLVNTCGMISPNPSVTSAR